jgi:outer membrane protein OmpA-like peptidoglycan-associated protein
MSKNLFIIIVILLLQPVYLIGQVNLVPNPSFEVLTSKPKKIGELDKAAPWVSPTTGTAEIFWSGAKSDDIKAPDNSIGFQQPRSGDNYAGAIFFDKKNANLREYLQVELTEELIKDKVYCLEFYISIADLSKYSVDLVGGHFSKNRISLNTMQPFKVTPQVQNKPGRLMGNQINWEIICGEFVSKGGEKYLTIGNFADDKQIQIGKMRKPKDYKTPQNEYGYYYIDDVSVIEQNANYKCDCYQKFQGIGASQMNLIYSKVSGDNEELLKPENLIESKIIRFEEHKSDISASVLKDLDLIVKLLQENSSFTIDVFGYADANELQTNGSLNEQRAQKIAVYIEKQGVRKNRITAQSGKAGKTSGKEPEKGTFRKVEFSVSIE